MINNSIGVRRFGDQWSSAICNLPSNDEREREREDNCLNSTCICSVRHQTRFGVRLHWMYDLFRSDFQFCFLSIIVCHSYEGSTKKSITRCLTSHSLTHSRQFIAPRSFDSTRPIALPARLDSTRMSSSCPRSTRAACLLSQTGSRADGDGAIARAERAVQSERRYTTYRSDSG